MTGEGWPWGGDQRRPFWCTVEPLDANRGIRLSASRKLSCLGLRAGSELSQTHCVVSTWSAQKLRESCSGRARTLYGLEWCPTLPSPTQARQIIPVPYKGAQRTCLGGPHRAGIRQWKSLIDRVGPQPVAGLRNVGLPPPTWPGSERLSSMGFCSPPFLAIQGTPPSAGLTGLGD